MANRAMIRDIVHFIEMANRNAARVCSSYRNASIIKPVARILLRGEYSKISTRNMCIAHRLALTAAQTVLDIGIQRAQLIVFEQQSFAFHQTQ
ncbi:hypothetical protein [Candidatus Thiothrix anitrata]|uniref:hypothetical protein n=1 Tax=Candidatus Thiothrix anitrata TaxID=2823902 RepID=UPI002B1BDEE6|nr:hypothetical protein [Candidatus Thiothrix anitrata]